jgi:flavodoxin
MHAIVVYESMFGNTQRVAEAVAAGIAAHMTVELIEVGAAPTQIGEDVGLLVVGGPTHAFGLSRQSTR